MLQLIQVVSDEQNAYIRLLFLEYIQWLQEKFSQEYGFTLNANDILYEFMNSVHVFQTSNGRLYLAMFGDEYVGIGCLKQLDNGIGEIKRMFVKAEYRGKGVGSAILDQLIADAGLIGYSKIRLDSPKISVDAHGLYQSRGFQYIDAYEGSEAAKTVPDFAVYMELVL